MADEATPRSTGLLSPSWCGRAGDAWWARASGNMPCCAAARPDSGARRAPVAHSHDVPPLHRVCRCTPLTEVRTAAQEQEFGAGALECSGTATPEITGLFEVKVNNKLVHSKKNGDGHGATGPPRSSPHASALVHSPASPSEHAGEGEEGRRRCARSPRPLSGSAATRARAAPSMSGRNAAPSVHPQPRAPPPQRAT